MMHGLVVAGPRPSQGHAAQIQNADIEDVSRLGVELLARPAPGLGQRRLTHRNPDLRVTIDRSAGSTIPAVRATEIERQGSTLTGHSVLCIGPRIPAGLTGQWRLSRASFQHLGWLDLARQA